MQNNTPIPLANYQDEPTFGTTRDGFGEGLKEAASENPQIVGLCADLTESTRMNVFKEAFPERFVQMGVAEENMVGLASGLALAGKIPFAASYAVFSPGNAWGAIRSSVCYSNLNVKLVGGHAGLTIGADGATHQALEDIAIMRVLPNMTVVVPCDQEEARKATRALARHTGPAYLRTGKHNTLNLTTPQTLFELGKALMLKDGHDATIIACGHMVALALQAAQQLEQHHFSVRVLNLHTIKPLDTQALAAAAKETGAIVTVEEHQVAGGMGSAVLEALAQSSVNVPTTILGVQDTFGESGGAEELLEKYGLTVNKIMESIKATIAQKTGV